LPERNTLLEGQVHRVIRLRAKASTNRSRLSKLRSPRAAATPVEHAAMYAHGFAAVGSTRSRVTTRKRPHSQPGRYDSIPSPVFDRIHSSMLQR
jgi:hypothetical protein